MHMACGLNFQPLETVRGLGKVIGKNLNMLIRSLGHSLQKRGGAHTMQIHGVLQLGYNCYDCVAVSVNTLTASKQLEASINAAIAVSRVHGF